MPLSVDIYNDQAATGDQLLHTRTYYDGFGRDMEDDQFVSASSFIQVLKTYDAMGRLYTTSTPAVPGSPFSPSWLTTYYPYDGLGRIKQVTTQADGAHTTTSYTGNQTIVTDEANKQRATWTDGLGRLEQVEEAPASDQFYTTYGYSPLDDLMCVNQGSVNQGTLGAVTTNPQIYSCQPGLAHSRSFTYDGLKRLTAANNPETGVIRYSYDNVGNLLTKTDAVPVTTCFGILSGSTCTSGYDALNRPTVKTYSDGKTPQVNYLYDAGPSGTTVSNSLGRLTQVSSTDPTTQVTNYINYAGYDPLGRITASSQVTNTITYQFPLYTYNRAGALLSETYPTNRVVATGYDGANRPAYLQGTLGTAVTPYIGVKSDASKWIQYWPSGEPWAFCRGSASSSLCHAASLNGRLQVVESYEAINNQDGPTSMLFLPCPGWGFSNDNNYGSLETAAELCEPTSIENAWCKAAASKDSKGARVFEAGSTSPKNGQFVSLPDGTAAFIPLSQRLPVC